MVYGYVRVSTKEQKEDRQLIAMEKCSMKADRIFADKQSGKDFNRRQYRAMVKKLKEGDIIIVKSIDRLGRNYEEILEQWRIITKVKKADIRVLDMPILDTAQNKNLIGTLISDIVLQLLSYVAENERVNIRQRQAEGIAAAKERGVKFGRQKKYHPEDFVDIYQQVKQGEISVKEAYSKMGVSESTYYRMKPEMERMRTQQAR